MLREWTERSNAFAGSPDGERAGCTGSFPSSRTLRPVRSCSSPSRQRLVSRWYATSSPPPCIESQYLCALIERIMPCLRSFVNSKVSSLCRTSRCFPDDERLEADPSLRSLSDYHIAGIPQSWAWTLLSPYLVSCPSSNPYGKFCSPCAPDRSLTETLSRIRHLPDFEHHQQSGPLDALLRSSRLDQPDLPFAPRSSCVLLVRQARQDHRTRRAVQDDFAFQDWEAKVCGLGIE